MCYGFGVMIADLRFGELWIELDSVGNEVKVELVWEWWLNAYLLFISVIIS